MLSVNTTRAETDRIRLGLCAMEKKLDSKPMKEILSRLRAYEVFELVCFPEETILNSAIEDWPHPVDFLISFFSDGFPLEKAEAYAKLRKPRLINDLEAQHLLLDRRKVYGLLEENGIPCPAAVIVERDPVTQELMGEAAKTFVETDDYIVVGERKLEKPFVEKPVDSEDHNICVYYPSSAGGGVKNLFRKIGNKSSEYDKKASRVRKDGTYMYESFFQTGGTDIKVYTVGPDYAHAEARKSPVIDGSVNRDSNGKEVRTPVVLTTIEKEIAQRVSTAFGQMVCGFDMLRTANSKSYVIDVNGWSFVKGVDKYYDDASYKLMQHMLHAMGKSFIPPPRIPSTPSRSPISNTKESKQAPSEISTAVLGRWKHQELLAVLAVMRHADRTPKNKMKMMTRRQEFIRLHEHWAKDSKKEAKLKTPEQLQEVLDLCKSMVAGDIHTSNSSRKVGHDSGSDATEDSDKDNMIRRMVSLDENAMESLRLLQDVLSEGEHFSGIHRKVQLKPTLWDAAGKVQELVIILKYGGRLTPAGREQTESLAQRFRGEMYPGEKDESAMPAGKNPAERGGLLRLHATQRHDFKVYSSDEGRVQMTAAAFSKGLLGLEGDELTPICVALVETDPARLDDLPAEAEPLMKDAKKKLQQRVFEVNANDPSYLSASDWHGKSDTHFFGIKELEKLHKRISEVCEQLQRVDLDAIETVPCGSSSQAPPQGPACVRCCKITKPTLVVKRWMKLRDDLYDSKKEHWDISKLTEIFDAVKFDVIHNRELVPGFVHVFELSRYLNQIVAPLEYGFDPESKSQIGAKVCKSLTAKLLADLRRSVETDLSATELPKWNLITAAQYLHRRLLGRPEDQARTGPTMEHSNSKDGFIEPEEDFMSQYVNPTRRVRTRLYFTSESHVQAMMNVLRYCHLGSGASGTGIFSKEAEDRLCADPVLDYLTQIVFRLYEDRLAAPDSDERFRVEILFSPGASDAIDGPTRTSHTVPLRELRPLHEEGQPLTLKCLCKLLEPYATGMDVSTS